MCDDWLDWSANWDHRLGVHFKIHPKNLENYVCFRYISYIGNRFRVVAARFIRNCDVMLNDTGNS